MRLQLHRVLVATGLATATLLGTASSSFAQAHQNPPPAALPQQAKAPEYPPLDHPPPAPQQDDMHAKAGYVMLPGHWTWEKGQYVWQHAESARVQPGMHFVPGQWVQRDGHWAWTNGIWAKGDAPPAPSWSMLKTSGKCLDALPAEVTKNEGKVRLMTCNGKDNQLWSLASGDRIINKAGNLCLDAHRAQMDQREGTVQLFTCHGQDNQTWRFDAGGHLQLSNGMCLDVQGNPPYPDEARVEVFSCTGGGSQDVWTFTVPGSASPADPPKGSH